MAVDGSADYDVCVAGAGGAGVTAALAAAEAGARVLLVEPATRTGGTTAMSIGSLMAVGSRRQLRITTEDSAQAHLADLRRLCAGGPTGDENLRQLSDLVAWSPIAVDWLEDHGVQIGGPLDEAGHRFPRMHMLQPSPDEVLRTLSRQAQELGVTVRTGTKVVELAPRADRWTVALDAVTQRIQATSVVLASGDSSAAAATPQRPPMNPHANGDAVTLARAVGGDGVREPHLSIAFRRYQFPHIEISKAVYGLGARLETAGGEVVWPVAAGGSADLAEALLGSAGQFFLVFDTACQARLTETNPVLCTFPDIGFATWSDLLRLGQVGFQAGRDHAGTRVAVMGPFGIFTALTDGAVRVDSTPAVVDRHGVALRGLFAAGAAAWGPSRLRGHGHHLSWTFSSGLMAGRAAARHAAIAGS